MDGQSAELVSGRLQHITTELRTVQQLITLQDIDLRVLSEFREAVNYVRHTAWAVEQWISYKEQGDAADPIPVLELLARNRIAVATQLCRELALNIQSGDVTRATEGFGKLAAELANLAARIQTLK